MRWTLSLLRCHLFYIAAFAQEPFEISDLLSSRTAPLNHLPCFQDAISFAKCCGAYRWPEPHATRAFRSCFDNTFTSVECCSGSFEQIGYARASPDFVPDVLSIGVPWKDLTTIGFEALKSRISAPSMHPAFSAEQRDFEDRHAKSTKTVFMSWRTASDREVFMNFRLFKRSLPLSGALYDSLFEYMNNGFLEHPLTASDVVVDVGASMGFFAVAVALHFPRVRVFAFEPSPQNYRYLLWNIRANNVTRRVWPVNVALAGNSMHNLGNMVPLRYSPTWPIVSTSCPVAEADCEFSEYSAPALTFPSLLELLGLRTIRWLKLDCEGCEWDIAEDPNFFELLNSSVQLISVELHPLDAPAGHGPRKAVAGFCLGSHEREPLLEAIRLKSNGETSRSVLAARMCSTDFS